MRTHRDHQPVPNQSGVSDRGFTDDVVPVFRPAIPVETGPARCTGRQRAARGRKLDSFLVIGIRPYA